MNRIHSAGRRTWPLLYDNGMIRTNICTSAAFHTFFLVNNGSAICPVQCDGTFWTDLHTRMCQAALAAIGYPYSFFMASVAGKFDHINQRRCIIGLRLICKLHIIRYRCMLCCISAWQSHGQTYPFSYDRSFQKYITSKASGFSRYNVIRYLLHCVCCRNLRVISHFCHFCKNRMTDFLYSRFYSSHSFSSRASIDSPDTLLTCIIRICISA